MSEATASSNRSPGGYRKGEETRARILAVALAEFGLHGFADATTRRIADGAGVNLPAINYYFGGKEGLYLACARDIAGRYHAALAAEAEAAARALAAPMQTADAAAQLKRLLSGLARFLLSSSEAAHRTLFVQREIASPGPAFEILYAELWRPGIDLAAGLIARILGARPGDGLARLRAVMMISSLTGLVEGRDIIARAVGEVDLASGVIAILEGQIDALASGGPMA